MRRMMANTIVRMPTAKDIDTDRVRELKHLDRDHPSSTQPDSTPCMRNPWLYFFVCWVFSLSGNVQAKSAPLAPEPFVVKIVQMGLFEIKGDIKDTDARSTAAGKVSEHSNSLLLKSTTSVPASRGTTFGFKYVVIGMKDGNHNGFEMRAIHPPMTGPNGQTSTVSQAPTYMFTERGVGVGDLLYTLSQEFEVLAGEWKLEILYQGRVVASQVFLLQ